MENMKKMDGIGVVETEANLKRDFMKTADKITDTAHEAKASANSALKNIQAYCRKNPGVAMGIAAGVGALVSIALIKAFSEKESENEKMISSLFRKAERTWNQVKSGISPVVNNIKESVGV